MTGKRKISVTPSRGSASRSRMVRCSWIASNECPPSAKKLSRGPICSTPSTSDHSACTACARSSVGALAATAVVASTVGGATGAEATAPGTGRCLRSSLRFGVSGIFSSRTIRPGTICAGRCASSASRSPFSHSSPAPVT